jgi:hypothetical protein
VLQSSPETGVWQPVTTTSLERPPKNLAHKPHRLHVDARPASCIQQWCAQGGSAPSTLQSDSKSGEYGQLSTSHRACTRAAARRWCSAPRVEFVSASPFQVPSARGAAAEPPKVPPANVFRCGAQRCSVWRSLVMRATAHLLQRADGLVHGQQELGDMAALRIQVCPQLPRRLAGLRSQPSRFSV